MKFRRGFSHRLGGIAASFERETARSEQVRPAAGVTPTMDPEISRRLSHPGDGRRVFIARLLTDGPRISIRLLVKTKGGPRRGPDLMAPIGCVRERRTHGHDPPLGPNQRPVDRVLGCEWPP